MITKRVKYEDLKKEAIYLSKVFGCNTSDVFTKEEIKLAKEQGYIDLIF